MQKMRISNFEVATSFHIRSAVAHASYSSRMKVVFIFVPYLVQSFHSKTSLSLKMSRCFSLLKSKKRTARARLHLRLRKSDRGPRAHQRNLPFVKTVRSLCTSIPLKGLNLSARLRAGDDRRSVHDRPRDLLRHTHGSRKRRPGDGGKSRRRDGHRRSCGKNAPSNFQSKPLTQVASREPF